MLYLPPSMTASTKLMVIGLYWSGTNVLNIYLCLFLLTEEFFNISLKVLDYLITCLRWVMSLKTSWRHYFLEAALNKDPAYLPKGVSVKDGGLCPENISKNTSDCLGSCCESKKLSELKFSSEHYDLLFYDYLIK